MDIEVIRSIAPLGSTHYQEDEKGIYFYKLEKDKLFVMSRKDYWLEKPIELLNDIKPLY